MNKETLLNMKEANYDFLGLLVIESEYKNKESTISSAVYNNLSLHGIEYYTISSFVFDNAIPNINSYNYRININGTIYTLVKGFYNTIALYIAHINDIIALSGVTLTYSPLTKLITIASGGPVFTFSNANPQHNLQLLRLLGFSDVLQGSNTYTGISKARLQYTKYIDVKSIALSLYSVTYNASLKSGSGTIIRIYTNPEIVGEGYNAYINPTTDIVYKFEPTRSVGGIDITMYDEYGTIIIDFIGEYIAQLKLYKRTYLRKNFST